MNRHRMQGMGVVGIIIVVGIASAIALGFKYVTDHKLMQIYDNRNAAVATLHSLEDAESVYMKAHGSFAGDFTHLLVLEKGGSPTATVFGIAPSSNAERMFYIDGIDYLSLEAKPDYLYKVTVKSEQPMRVEINMAAANLQLNDWKCTHYQAVLTIPAGGDRTTDPSIDESCSRDDS